ncbi:MAG: spore protease YyaC [Bacillota bacterium]
MKVLEEKKYFNTKESSCQFKLNQELHILASNQEKQYSRIAIVGIGTDRSTGDSFGPLVGYMLSKCSIYDFDVYGTILDPVHALNLSETMNKIDTSTTLVIAVDASIGRLEHIGQIVLSNEPIKPGIGVGKNLPPVGDISIAGVVTLGGIMPSTFMLQNTSLGLVYKMAEITANALKYLLYKHQLEPKRIKRTS